MAAGFAAPQAPLPVLMDETRAFWTGGREGQLLIARCQDCGCYSHPPQPVCSKCLSVEMQPEAVSGKAILASFTVNHQPWRPGMVVPFVIGVVELVEQPSIRLTTNIVETPLEHIHIGMAVSVCFEQREDVWLPLFREERSK